MRKLNRFTVTMALCVAAIVAVDRGEAKGKKAAYAPAIDPANFQSTVDHPFFPLVPGTSFRLTEHEGRQVRVNEITVTHDTKVILGVTCTVVHDVEKEHDAVKEDTYDWYAQDKQGNVWYFGEDTKEHFPLGRVSTEGSWTAGTKGGQPGIIMPAVTTPGRPYRQEYQPGVAEDMGQIVAVDQTITVPAGTYSGCVKTKDWSLLEAGYEYKWYAKGIGFVRGESASKEIAELEAVTKP